MVKDLIRIAGITVLFAAATLIAIQVNDEGTGMLINERPGLAIAALLVLAYAVVQTLHYSRNP